MDGQGQQQDHLPPSSTVSSLMMSCSSPGQGTPQTCHCTSVDVLTWGLQTASVGTPGEQTCSRSLTTAPPCWETWGRARQGFESHKVNQVLWQCGSCRDSTGFPEFWGNISLKHRAGTALELGQPSGAMAGHWCAGETPELWRCSAPGICSQICPSTSLGWHLPHLVCLARNENNHPSLQKA